MPIDMNHVDYGKAVTTDNYIHQDRLRSKQELVLTQEQIKDRDILGKLKNGGLKLADIISNYLVSEASAAESNPNGYNYLIPDLNGVRPYETITYDGNKKIPGKETLIERFRTQGGGVVARLSVDNKVFAYSIREGNKDKGYAVVDSDGSGRFKEKYYDGEVFEIPDWLIKQVMSKR